MVTVLCPLKCMLLIQVLLGDLEHAHRLEEERRIEGGYSAAEMLRFSIADVADHIERFEAVYRLALDDPADANHEVIVQFMAYGFAGAIKAWLSGDSVKKDDLIYAVAVCAPGWWS
jgi:hypothetical protein